MPNQLRRRANRQGFTLIELLTVIGIMCILMGILLPTVSTVWKMSQKMRTSSEMANLSTAIYNYNATEGAFPGPIRDESIFGYGVGGVPALIPLNFVPPSTPLSGHVIPAPPTNLTSSENLVLGLIGGLLPSSSPAGVYFDPAQVAMGPYSLNAMSPAQKKAYYDVSANRDELSQDGSGNLTSYTNTVSGNALAPGITSGQFIVPEFMDHFPNPHPIIYLRARDGTGIVDVSTTGGALGSQYYSSEMSPYWVTYSSVTSPMPAPTAMFPSTPDPGNNGVVMWATAPTFFQNPQLQDGVTPRGNKGFILISAGADGLFGTKDDIVIP